MLRTVSQWIPFLGRIKQEQQEEQEVSSLSSSASILQQPCCAGTSTSTNAPNSDGDNDSDKENVHKNVKIKKETDEDHENYWEKTNNFKNSPTEMEMEMEMETATATGMHDRNTMAPSQQDQHHANDNRQENHAFLAESLPQDHHETFDTGNNYDNDDSYNDDNDDDNASMCNRIFEMSDLPGYTDTGDMDMHEGHDHVHSSHKEENDTISICSHMTASCTRTEDDSTDVTIHDNDDAVAETTETIKKKWQNIHVGTHLSVYWPKNGQYYHAKVIERKQCALTKSSKSCAMTTTNVVAASYPSSSSSSVFTLFYTCDETEETVDFETLEEHHYIILDNEEEQAAVTASKLKKWQKLQVGTQLSMYSLDDNQYYDATTTQQFQFSGIFTLQYKHDGCTESLDFEKVNENAFDILEYNDNTNTSAGSSQIDRNGNLRMNENPKMMSSLPEKIFSRSSRRKKANIEKNHFSTKRFIFPVSIQRRVVKSLQEKLMMKLLHSKKFNPNDEEEMKEYHNDINEIIKRIVSKVERGHTISEIFNDFREMVELSMDMIDGYDKNQVEQILIQVHNTFLHDHHDYQKKEQTRLHKILVQGGVCKGNANVTTSSAALNNNDDNVIAPSASSDTYTNTSHNTQGQTKSNNTSCAMPGHTKFTNSHVAKKRGNNHDDSGIGEDNDHDAKKRGRTRKNHEKTIRKEADQRKIGENNSGVAKKRGRPRKNHEKTMVVLLRKDADQGKIGQNNGGVAKKRRRLRKNHSDPGAGESNIWKHEYNSNNDDGIATCPSNRRNISDAEKLRFNDLLVEELLRNQRIADFGVQKPRNEVRNDVLMMSDWIITMMSNGRSIPYIMREVMDMDMYFMEPKRTGRLHRILTNIQQMIDLVEANIAALQFRDCDRSDNRTTFAYTTSA